LPTPATRFDCVRCLRSGTKQTLVLSTFQFTHQPPLRPAQVVPALREWEGGSTPPTGPAPLRPTTSACSLVLRHRCDLQARHRQNCRFGD